MVVELRHFAAVDIQPPRCSKPNVIRPSAVCLLVCDHGVVLPFLHQQSHFSGNYCDITGKCTSFISLFKQNKEQVQCT